MSWGAPASSALVGREPDPDPRGGARPRARGLDLRAPLRPAAGDRRRARAPACDGPGTGRRQRPLARAGARGGRGSDRAAGSCSNRRAIDDGEAGMSGPRPVRAPRGTELSCRGWPQEAAMRMLMNNLDPDVAEHPDELVVYGGTGRAARSWDAFDAIVANLRTLRGRRDAAGAVRQARRALPDPRVVAARADRQLEPRPRVGATGTSSAAWRSSA